MVATSGRWGRLAPSLVAMEREADRIAPNRRRTSDGSLGDQSHASRYSFHNPSGGYVDALDLSHDPAHGFDAHARARQIVARRDSRIDHVISNRQIWSVQRPYWRRYTGSNPHTMHAHFAVKRNATGRLPTGAWWPHTPAPPKPIPEDDVPFIVTCAGKATRIKDGPTCHTIGETTRKAAEKAGLKVVPHTAKDYDALLKHVEEALGR